MIDVFNPTAWGTTATTNVISLILVIATGITVILNWKIANANKGMLDNIREQYQDSLRPVVFPSLQFRDQVVVRLVISNSGRSPAYQLRVTIDSDFLQFGERRNIRDFSVFNEEIPVFPPGAEIAIDLAQGFNFDREIDGRNITPSQFNVGVSYSSRNQQFDEIVPIDLTPYFQTHHAKSAAEWLGKIEDQLKKIAQKIG